MYLRLLGAHLRAALQYEADFWIMIVAAALTQGVGLVFLSALFSRIPQLSGWTFHQVALMYAMVTVTEGVGSLFFEGMWRLAGSITTGELDYALVRPYPVALQVMGSAVGFNGLGNLLLGGLMIAVALPKADLPWSPGFALILLILFLSAIVIKLSISMATNAMSFWLAGPNPVFAYAVHQLGELARFPIGIYSAGVRLVLTVLLPLAFTSYYPVSFAAGSADRRLGLLTPVVAAGCLLIGTGVFRRGLARYDSAGN